MKLYEEKQIAMRISGAAGWKESKRAVKAAALRARHIVVASREKRQPGIAEWVM